MKKNTDTVKFIHRYMTDEEIDRVLSDPIKGGTPEQQEANHRFHTLLKEELLWRYTNNKHYTLEQKIKDIQAHHAKIVAQKALGVSGYIPPDKYWYE